MDVYEQFEKLIEEDKITFRASNAISLSQWAKLIIKTYLDPSNITWTIGSIEIDGVICLKLNHPILHYLDIDTPNEQFMFCVDNHKDSISPNDASIILLRGIGIDASVIKNGGVELWSFKKAYCDN